MSDVMEILKRGDNSLEALLRAVLLDSDNKVPAERLRIVGALTSGHIIESGSNANGNYARFADGTQVCWGSYPHSFNTTDTIQSVQITFPAAFVSSEIAGAAYHKSAPGLAMINTNFNTTATILTLNFVSMNDAPPTTTDSKPIHWFAIGKWK